MPYPTASEVSEQLTAAGLPIPVGLDRILGAVISDFEAKTGFVPFAESTDTVEVTFDPPNLIPGYVLDLLGGFWSVDSVEIDGTALTTDEYDLLPLDAAIRGVGWNAIRFRNHPGSEPASIVVTGKRGYAQNCPDDVYLAILDEATGRAIVRGSAGTFIATEIKQGQVTVKGGGSGDESGSKASLFCKAFTAMIRKYVRA